MQVQYASIGWSVGATLGLSAAAKPAGRRVFAVIGGARPPFLPDILDCARPDTPRCSNAVTCPRVRAAADLWHS